MNGFRTLRALGNTTRRVQGRRSLTPIRPKKKRILKTRSGKRVENGLPIQQFTGSRSARERCSQSKKEHSRDSQWKGNEDSGNHGKWEDSEKHQEAESLGDEKNSEQSVYPGSLQELHELSEHAVTEIPNETEFKEEGIP